MKLFAAIYIFAWLLTGAALGGMFNPYLFFGTTTPGVPPTLANKFVTSNSATNTLSITASVAHAGSQSAVIVVTSLSTTNTSSVPTVSSVTGTGGDGLSFSKRTSASLINLSSQCSLFGPCSIAVEVWHSAAPNNFTSHTITVTYGSNFNGGNASAAEVYGLNNNAAPWDTNGSLPVIASNTSGGVPSFTGYSTSAAGNLVLAVLATASGTTLGAIPCFLTHNAWADTGLVHVFSSISQSVLTQGVTATQSGIGVNMTKQPPNDVCPGGTSEGFGWILIMDALRGN